MLIKNLYLILYNLLQGFGWTYIVYKSTKYFHLRIDNDSLELWHSVEHPLKFYQTLAVLEVGIFFKVVNWGEYEQCGEKKQIFSLTLLFWCILLFCIDITDHLVLTLISTKKWYAPEQSIFHVIIGIVKSNVPITTFQVLARLLNLWGILSLSPPTQKSIGLPLIIIAWGITEIIRYGYYITALLKLPPVLQWFRYSVFIILYPLGLIGELVDIYYTVRYVKGKNVWGYVLPSWLDFGVTYYHVIITLTCILVPLTPFLFLHMLSQRRKMLSQGKQSKVKSK